MIANTKRLAGTLPVVSVGDYNTSKFSTYAATYLPKMKLRATATSWARRTRHRCRGPVQRSWTEHG